MDRETERETRHLSLEHWFVNHQLRALKAAHFHLPGNIEVDVTPIASGLDNPHAYFTAIVVKAIGLTLEAVPEANAVYMKTLFGPRLLRPNYIAVNLPILVREGEKRVLTAISVRDPQRKTVDQIRDEIRAAVQLGLKGHPLARFLATHRNRWYNRLALRGLALVAMRVPSAYLKFGGGGCSLSSLLADGKGQQVLSTSSYGPTAFTIVLTSLWQEDGRWLLRLGVGFDHFAGPGTLAVQFSTRLSAVLSSQNITSTFGEMHRAHGSSLSGTC